MLPDLRHWIHLVFFPIYLLTCITLTSSYKKNLYPQYCSVSSEMKTRDIPPLKDDDTYLQTQLLQVTIIMRHGSRTPHDLENCWEGYSAQWDCVNTMTTLMKPASSVQNTTKQGFLFEKKYDVGKNVLVGSCLKGQLIEEGYKQQLQNARILRSAYITTNNSNQQLFESTQYGRLPYSNAVRFRADDKQRALVSGQILLSSLFDVPADNDIVMSLITADYSRDVLTIHEETCPVLKEISNEAYSSEEYLQILNSNDNKELMKVFANKTLNWKNPEVDLIDCLMTTYCNDRQDSMPDSLWIGGKFSSKEEGVTDDDGSLFSRLFNFYEWKKSFHLTYNNAEYSKIGIAPLLGEITDILKLTSACNSLEEAAEMNLTRLNLISGHDTTLSTIMASWNVWDGRLAPYSSMLVLESYYVIEKATLSNITHVFRLLYNGQIITSKFPGCLNSTQLCDLNVFLNYVAPFAIRDRSCKRKDEGSALGVTSYLSLKGIMLIAIGSYIIGSIATYLALSRMDHNIFEYSALY